ncbi:MAG: hypothetical protein H0W72_05350 [Planctomycetes bacterium]|nr:hypothetical protein [Planctomycetota bacterium]
MGLRTISDLVRTMSTYFRFGTVRLKDSSGVLEVKNAADAAYVPAAASRIDLKGSTSGETGFQAPATAGAANIYTLPTADGSSGQVLQTNGSKVLAWATVATGSNADKSYTDTIAYNNSSPVTMFTPPALAHIKRVIIDVGTAFDAVAPSISVGVAGTTSRYMGTTDVDLATVGVYEVQPCYEEDGTPEPVIITFAAGTGGTVGSAIVTVEYANPD